MFGFYIESSRERTLGGKWFVSTSLAAPEGIVDVTNRKSALPTITTRESHLCTTFRTCCLFEGIACWSRRPRSAPD